jgi:hypothetical protein
MDCPKCGALLQESQEICPACGGQIPKQSLWQRLLKFFLPTPITQTKVARTSKVELRGISLDNIPPEFRDKLDDALASGQEQLTSLEEISPELRDMLEQGIASGQTKLLSIEEIPPEIRSRFKDVIVSGQGITKQVICFQSPDGQRHTYHSLEEMPAEIRRKFKEIMESPRDIASEVFTYQGPDGLQHTHHSLEEMPPDIRAFFRIASEARPQE